MNEISATGRPGLSIGFPVFVLCCARSGSTLLRFILDAHPELACPPETNLPALCAQLATVWSLIAGAPLSPERGEEPPVIPDTAIAGIRHTVDEMIGSYLARRGRSRYCDKSLGTARFADLLTRVYPETKFLCLYRHPMDVIASGIEASPWGPRGYGFDSYIAATPGNTVLALARYWSDNNAAILAVEDRFPGACYRVRYEDLVTDPEGTAAEVFGFLGVPQAPGTTARCFTAERERSGPADYKIWHTTSISPASVGRGWTLPVGMIPESVLGQMNEMAGRLGYLQVDSQWGATAAPDDMRADGRGAQRLPDQGLRLLPGPGGAAGPGGGTEAEADSAETLISQRLGSGLAALNGEFTRRWDANATAPFGIVITGASGSGRSTRWRVDLAARNATRLGEDEDDGTEWDVLGSAAAWAAVLDRRVNLGVALRSHELRYCDTSDDQNPSATNSRIDMLADMLGVASWPATATFPQHVAAGK
jgi:sulfotransferase family protein